MSERHDPHGPTDFAALNGWDREYEVFSDFDLPTYVGPTTFMKLPWMTDPAELAPAPAGRGDRRGAVRRRGQPPAGRAVRAAGDPRGASTRRARSTRSSSASSRSSRSTSSTPATRTSCPAWIERAHALIYRKVLEVAGTGAIPIVLGGDHSITWPVRDGGRRGPSRRARSASSTSTPTPTPPTRTGASSPGTARRCAGSSSRGRSTGRNFVQVGLRGYWPPPDVFEWMREHGLRCHFMTEIEERGAEAVVADAIAEALDGPDAIYLSSTST